MSGNELFYTLAFRRVTVRGNGLFRRNRYGGRERVTFLVAHPFFYA